MMRLLKAGLAGGIAASLAMVLTFRTIGFGWDGKGFLVTASDQSAKLIAVWTTLQPLPLAAVNPTPIMIGLTLLAIGHAWIFRGVSTGWPAGVWSRVSRLASLIFFMSYLFFEFFTPFNMFGEPLWLIVVELTFWATIALAEAFAIVVVMERGERR